MVFVVSSDGYPLDPCHPARARQLLRRGRARLVRCFPCTIRLMDRSVALSTTHVHRLKIDPGSCTTGLTVLAEHTSSVVWAVELTHRSQTIHATMVARSQNRRQRRRRKTRFRPERFLNRRRLVGWLPPSLHSRVQHLTTWVRRLRTVCPLAALSLELVRFDPQAMQNPEISGIAYQQGELQGYEVREYLLDKWERHCAYCGATDVALQVEHIVPRSRGGSDRVSNLTLACAPCNTTKGNRTAAEYGFPQLHDQGKLPLRDAGTMNTTRWALYHQLVATGLLVEVGTGARTKYNRVRLGLPKTHWLDAACVGASTPQSLKITSKQVLQIAATGRGLHSRTKMDRFGFPRIRLPRQKRFFGFQTGDMAIAIVTTGKKQGRYVGRVAVRASGSFDITTAKGTVQGISQRFFRLIQRADGYRYSYQSTKDAFVDSATP
jgi:5-methylcytosine-specific restriction endonuclease McrA